jgi:hypothetical protein
MKRTKDFLDQMMDYEMGLLNDYDTLKMFSGLIKDNVIYSLQGHYGRTASALIEDGWLDRQGEILKDLTTI